MPDAIDALILDLLEWIGPRPRAYADIMDAWRTSCPRLPIWEEAETRGLVERRQDDGGGAIVCVTAMGRALVDAQRPRCPPPSRDRRA